MEKPVQDQFVIKTNEKRLAPKPEILPVFVEKPVEPIFVEKPGNFAESELGTDEEDLKAFHDELDRLINGENPNGEFKTFFRNPSSLSFETVQEDQPDQTLTIVTVAPFKPVSDYQVNPDSEEQESDYQVNVGPYKQVSGGQVEPVSGYQVKVEPHKQVSKVETESEKQVSDYQVNLAGEAEFTEQPINTEPPVLIGRYSDAGLEKKVAERAILGQSVDPIQNIPVFNGPNPSQNTPIFKGPNPNQNIPVFKRHRAQPLGERPQQPRSENAKEVAETTEIVYGLDGNGDTQIDVVVLEGAGDVLKLFIKLFVKKNEIEHKIVLNNRRRTRPNDHCDFCIG